MSRLFVIKQQNPTEQASIELRHAFATTLREARRVFSETRVIPPGEAAETVQPSDYVLPIAHSGIYLSHTSLQRMRQQIDHHPNMVSLSVPLQQFDLSQIEAFQTPRGYERVERVLLDRLDTTTINTDTHLPVALFGGEAFLLCFDANRFFSEPQLLSQATCSRIQTRIGGIHFRFSDYYGSERRDLLPFIAEGTRKVLEIGCASGNTGRMLKQELGCWVTGVESHPDIAALARDNLDCVLQGEFQSLDINGDFDLVIAADVLEHQDDIGDFLYRMQRSLHASGRILLSVPNIGHYTIVDDLLAGRWDYVPQGLLCITHLRFFTRTTLEDWLQQLGFVHYEIHAQAQSGLPQRFERLAETFELDRQSLRTPGFYVVIHTCQEESRDRAE